MFRNFANELAKDIQKGCDCVGVREVNDGSMVLSIKAPETLISEVKSLISSWSQDSMREMIMTSIYYVPLLPCQNIIVKGELIVV